MHDARGSGSSGTYARAAAGTGSSSYIRRTGGVDLLAGTGDLGSLADGRMLAARRDDDGVADNTART